MPARYLTLAGLIASLALSASSCTVWETQEQGESPRPASQRVAAPDHKLTSDDPHQTQPLAKYGTFSPRRMSIMA